MNNKNRRIAYTGFFIALVIGVGFALILVPNVELVTAIIFLSGVLMGVKTGLIVGLIGEFLFSVMNPLGSGILFPPMLIAQMIAMSIIGVTGGLLQKILLKDKIGRKEVFLIGGVGFLLTLIYDILVSMAFPITSGFTINETIGAVLAGLGFSIVHIVVNTIIFFLLIPVISRKIYNAIPYFRENSNLE